MNETAIVNAPVNLFDLLSPNDFVLVLKDKEKEIADTDDVYRLGR
jgi:hypothetical protein